MFFCADNRLRVTSWGEELAGLTGRKPQEVQGRKYFEVLPRILSGDRDALLLAVESNEESVVRGYAFHCLFDHMTADIRISPIRAAGKVKGVRVSFSDFSLCSVVRSFRNSKRFIDIGKTASTLAHGVRNPLNAIKGAVVYLTEKYAGEPALVEFARIINEEIARLDNFISRFLSTTVSDAAFRLTDVNALLKKMEAFTSLQAQASRIRTVYEFGNIPPVMASSFQVEQAVLNVINNAMDAMPSGGQLSVKTRTETLSGYEFVVIEISDTGSGMAGRAADPATPPEGKGKGFGLVITREILQHHGGHMEIKSKRHKGTSVRLCLPLKKVETPKRAF